ncbi:cell division control protein 6 homolog B [Rhododendron vialii]|uniref:cell division control protein 6 homolog B n=1 Tax=Rhododendron vialii TaxID=182163 RepID=UPI00266004C8|nr:cell division control protein 6 homolog B [Rhododendron vialii]XP_058202635.1 cell division control protein 6 homolog B [Rhododendron vialii]
MPSIAGNGSPPFAVDELKRTKAVKVEKSGEVRASGDSTPGKRRLRSNSAAAEEDGGPIATTPSPTKWKSPRRCVNGTPNSPANRITKEYGNKLGKSDKSLVKKLSDAFIEKPNWNPRDVEQLSAVKDKLHVSTAPCTLVCREDEQKRVLQFCRQCIEQEKAGSLYVCGCPGTGKSLSMERVKESLIKWAKEAGFQQPDVLTVNCTSLTNTSEIFSKIVGKNQPQKKTTSPLQNLQNLYSQKQQSAGMKMMLIIADELDYLITKDRAVLHDLFMLTTFPSSRCILIGIANAIDLADRFLPRLQSLNCKPMVVTFRAYSKDQIMLILQQRLKDLPYTVFQPQALELCARKVAAACGDMRKALCICRSAIEMLEAELRESVCNLDLSSADIGFLDQRSQACDLIKQNSRIVRVDHMAIALSKTYRSPVVDTIQSLPQHQQIILCSAVKLFRGGKKDATIGELSKSYLDICKLILIPPVGIMELSSMCRVLGDQGILKLGQAREDKLRRVTLNVDEADIAFALQGIRVFRNCLNAGNKNMDL